MEETIEKQVTSKDIIKHYFSSLIIYGIILAFIILCPLYYESIKNQNFDYTAFFYIYYIGYLVFAPVIFFAVKPKSILKSRNIAIINYVKRQFRKNETTEEFLKNIEPKEDEKQAFTILFMKTFFGVYTVNILCNDYLANLKYNFEFLYALYAQAITDISTGLSKFSGILQYVIDTGDVWLKLILTLTTLVLAFSYLTELDLLKNKIKSVDTTPLGILTCIACYYPVTLITNKAFQVTTESLIPVNNQILLAILNILVILVNIGILISILRLGSKSGNLTNRGIVTGFPYNIVRHPNYSLYIMYILLTTIPLIVSQSYSIIEKTMVLGATFIWIYIYYLRSITEERHLIKDPEYQKYVEKVKYRFIPKIL